MRIEVLVGVIGQTKVCVGEMWMDVHLGHADGSYRSWMAGLRVVHGVMALVWMLLMACLRGIMHKLLVPVLVLVLWLTLVVRKTPLRGRCLRLCLGRRSHRGGERASW